MAARDYRELPPVGDETAVGYASRLERMACDEMFIRKGLRYHFAIEMAAFGDFFENFPAARLRHVRLLEILEPNRTRYSLVLKLSKNLGISRERAEHWIDLYEARRSEFSWMQHTDF